MQHLLRVASWCLLISCALVQAEDFVCKSPGKYSHSDPRKYHECHLIGNDKFTHFEQSCPIDNCFIGASQSCKFSEGACPNISDEDRATPSPINFPCPELPNDENNRKYPHPDPSRKGSYIRCMKIYGNLIAYEYQCLPTKPCFHPEKRTCQVCNLN